jgi:hypothetical protein
MATNKDFVTENLRDSKNKVKNDYHKLFWSKKINKNELTGSKVKNKELYVWDIEQKYKNMVDKIYLNLPFYAKSIEIGSKIALGQGISPIDKSKNNDPVYTEFLESFSSNMFYDCYKEYKTTGNFAISLVKSEDNKTSRFVMFNLNKIVFVTSNNDNDLAEYGLVGVAVKSNKGYVMLDEKNTIVVRSSPTTVLGLPPSLLQHQLSINILNDIKANEKKGFKKDLVTFSNMDGSEVETSEIKDLGTKLKTLVAEIDTPVLTTNKQVAIQRLDPYSENVKFSDNMNNLYILHATKLAGIAAYMIMSPKNINRSTAEQQYKEMLEYDIKPINMMFTTILNRMYQIWCKASDKVSELQLTIPNPKANIDMYVAAQDIIKLFEMQVLTREEVRASLGYENIEDLTKQSTA